MKGRTYVVFTVRGGLDTFRNCDFVHPLESGVLNIFSRTKGLVRTYGANGWVYYEEIKAAKEDL